MTIGIVDESRTDFADFDNFRYLTGANFSNPTEIVPTAFGGVDPGPAYTSPPGGSISTGEQGEATLDVLRAGSVAPNAQTFAGGCHQRQRRHRSRCGVSDRNYRLFPRR